MVLYSFIALCDILFGITLIAYAVLELMPTGVLYGLGLTGMGLFTLLFRPKVVVFSVIPVAVTLIGILWVVSYVGKLQQKQQPIMLAMQHEIKKRLNGKNTPQHAQYAVGAVVALVAMTVVTIHFRPERTVSAEDMTCGKFLSLSSAAQADVIKHTPGYMGKDPSVFSGAAARIAYNCSDYPANTLITNPNIMY